MSNRMLFGFVFLLGLIFTFLVPPFQKPDENRHYYQSYALSNLVFRCQSDSELGTYLPVPALAYNFPSALKMGEIAQTPSVKFFRSQFGWYPHGTSESIVKATDWCSWSPIGYIPASIGLSLGKVSHSLIVEFYSARLFSLFFFMYFLYLGLKITPKQYQKWLWFFAYLPMTMHQVSAISYDTVLLSMIPIIFGFTAQFVANPSLSPGKKTILAFCLSLLIFVLAKPAMIAFFLLILLIPKQKIWIKLGLVTVAILLTIPFLSPLHYRDLSVGINPSLQAEVIKRDPLYVAQVIADSITGDTQTNLEGIVGRLGWLDYQFDYYVYTIAILIFGILLSTTPSKRLAKPFAWWVIGIVILSTLLATYAALYMTWVVVGGDRVVGVQGRYLLPFVPFFALWLSSLLGYLKASLRLQYIFLILGAVWLLYQVLTSVYLRYFDYSKYGVNDLDPLPLDSEPTQLSSGTYHLTFPGSTAKVVGFYLYPVTQPQTQNIYRYEVKSEGCDKSYRLGYFNLIDHKSKTSMQVRFDPVTLTGGSICLQIESIGPAPADPIDLIPLTPTDPIKPLYLIPSLH